VLDASAVLALLRKEPGHEEVAQRLEGSVISTVNWSEVLGRGGNVDAELRPSLEALGLSIVAFTIADAVKAGEMWRVCSPLGIGLADRACLALGERLGVEVVTADRRWADLDFANVRLIR
jgi:ribonuclease VapC